MARAATVILKSKTPDIDVLTKPKDLSTIKGEAVDHVGTAKPKVDLDVPEVKGIHDVEAPKVKNPQVKATISPIKNMPLEEYEMYRTKSVINPDSDTMTLGKYEPTIRPDGTQDWSTPGPNSYISKAGDTTYFSLGDDWNKLTEAYHLDSRGEQMFEAFNKPALDDAVAQGKTIRFSHDPTLKIYEKSAIRWEWDYLKEHHGYKDVDFVGGYWYADK